MDENLDKNSAVIGENTNKIPEKEAITKQLLRDIYGALEEKGYNAINQIIGYILSEDPTYITTYKNARQRVRQIDRDFLLSIMVKNFINAE